MHATCHPLTTGKGLAVAAINGDAKITVVEACSQSALGLTCAFISAANFEIHLLMSFVLPVLNSASM